MLDRTLKQIRLIKFAEKAPFYWYSPWDPYADSYEAVQQELLDAHDRILHQMDPNTRLVTIKGKKIPISAINALFDAQWENNDTLAEARRNHKPWLTTLSLAGGFTGGGLLGNFAGSKLIGALGGSKKHKKWGGRVGGVLGGLAGAILANHIATKIRNDSMPGSLDDGTSVLKQLNESMANLYSSTPGGNPRDTLSEAESLFADISKPGTAVERKLNSGK